MRSSRVVRASHFSMQTLKQVRSQHSSLWMEHERSKLDRNGCNHYKKEKNDRRCYASGAIKRTQVLPVEPEKISWSSPLNNYLFPPPHPPPVRYEKCIKDTHTCVLGGGGVGCCPDRHLSHTEVRMRWPASPVRRGGGGGRKGENQLELELEPMQRWKEHVFLS